MTPRRTDSSIHHDVLEELKLDGCVRETDVGVLAHDAVVTLTGTVPTFAMKVAAQELAHRVDGVLDVVDDIEVHICGIGPPDDTQIAHAVRDALEARQTLPHRRIRTTISRGTVALEGSVFTAAQRDEASEAIRHVRGVAGILNRLDVVTPVITVPEIRSAIENALQRHIERELDHLDITINGGQVTLAGHVDSWVERRAIVGMVRGMAGVSSVVDDLVVAASGTVATAR